MNAERKSEASYDDSNIKYQRGAACKTGLCEVKGVRGPSEQTNSDDVVPSKPHFRASNSP